MKTITLFSSIFIALTSNMIAAAQQFISIETKNTSIVLATAPDNTLNLMHYGAKVGSANQYKGFATYRRSDYATDPMAYPTRGGRYFNEPALAVSYEGTERNTELRYVSHTSRQLPGATLTEVVLKDEKTALEVKLCYTAYEKEDVILCHSEITNQGSKDICLENYASSAIDIKANKYLLTHFYGAWAREMQVESELLTHGTKVIESKKGVRTTHTENPSFMISLNTNNFDENHGEVIAGALAWSGNYKLSFQIDETNRLSILTGINPYSSTYTLKKGATFCTPDMIWTFSLEGAGQASRNLHDWARQYSIYSKGKMAPTLLNSWEGAYFDFTTPTLTGMIDDAAQMGLEMFVLDDGWFGVDYPRNSSKQGLGDWQLNTKKIPEGIEYLADYAHQKGLKFGIWIEPEMVNPKSNLAKKHPDWVVQSENHEKTTMRNQWLLDLSNPKVQDFVYSIFDETMKLAEGKIDYIKWDCNRHVENFGSTFLKDQEMFFVNYMEGFYNVMRRLRQKYPNTIVQSCASGGGRVDYGALRFFDEVWTSDNTEALSRVFIQYGTNMIYPACTTGSHVSAVPNHQTNNVTPLKFRFDIASAGRLGMELQPKKMTDEERDFAKKAIASYKSFRDIVEHGDLYRLASPYEGGHYALMYVSKDKKRAVVFGYCIKYQGRTQTPLFRLYGLDENKSYKITELNTTTPLYWGNGHTFSGLWLKNEGINPQLVKLYDSGIWLLEQQ